MSHEPEHVDFETLNDYVDGRLARAEVVRVEEHVRQCSECSGELADLRSLLSSVASLPKEVLPEDDLWSDLRSSIEQRKEIVLPLAAIPGTTPTTGTSGSNKWRSRGLLAVAAVVLVVLSSGITAVVLRTDAADDAEFAQERAQVPAGNAGAPPVLPASFAVAEGKYVMTIDELRTAFDAQRSTLNPQTVRTVDRSLAVIDSAITEARDALLADPGNRTLVDLLSANYQRKLDLLRRTSELSSRI